MAKPYTPVNEVQSDIATGNTWTRGTDTSIVLTDASEFDAGGGYIRIGDQTSYADMEYTGKTSNTLTGLTACTLGVVVSSGDETKEWPAGTEVSRVLAAEDLECKLEQCGDPSWYARTHESYEIVDTAHTYTVGSGQDFATLAAAAAALTGMIITTNITVQLKEAIEITTGVVLSGLISCGGGLILDLNNYDITCNHTSGYAITASGPFEFYPRDVTGSAYASIIAGASCTGSGLVRWDVGAMGSTYNIDFDANSKAILNCIYVSNRSRITVLANTSFSNSGSLTHGEVEAATQAWISESVSLSDHYITGGAMVITSAGAILTSGGTLTPS